MRGIFDAIIAAPPWIGLAVLLAAFWSLTRCSAIFVDRSVAIAHRLRIPKIVIGIVLVALATTVPEVAVSVQSALDGHPQIALGNVIGSVICNSGLALAACALLAPRPVHVLPDVLRLTGGALLLLSALTLGFVMYDGTLSRPQGGVLLIALAAYLLLLLRGRSNMSGEASGPASGEAAASSDGRSLGRLLSGFGLALLVVVLASRFVLAAAIGIARSLNVPRSVIALTLVSLGTSIPEVATSITAARRGHGEIAIGNILGANILNLGWVAGLSALVTPLTLTPLEVRFMFPTMFAFVLLTLVMLRTHTVISRREGVWLLLAYGLYLAVLLPVFGGANA